MRCDIAQPIGVRGFEQLEGTAILGRVEGLAIVAGAIGTRDFTVCCKEEPCPPDEERSAVGPCGGECSVAIRYSRVLVVESSYIGTRDRRYG